MGNPLSDKAKESAAIRAEKRAAALRENLKRRKAQSESQDKGKTGNAEPKTAE